MSNALTLNRQGRSILDAAVTGLGFARHPMISRAGNRFTLVDNAGNTKNGSQLDPAGRMFIDLVIFDASPHPNQMYFAGPYENDSNQPPDCFSDNGKGPSTQSRNPQAPTCAACPHAKWGSKITPQGKGVPACQTGKKLAVIVADDPSGMAFEFRVPPGSFGAQPDKDPMEGGWTWYCKALKGYGKELFDVVTRVSFVPNTMGVMVFKPVAVVEGTDLARQVNDAWAKKVEVELIGLEDRAIDPASFGQLQAPAPMAQVQQTPLPPPQPVQQPAFLPPAGGQLTGQVQPPFPVQQGQQAGQMAQEPPKRTRRTKAQIAADNAAQGAGQGAPPFLATAQQNPPPFITGTPAAPAQGAPVLTVGDIPPFLRRTQDVPAPAPMPGGLQNPQEPSADLQAKMAAAFNLPTGGSS